MRRLDAWERAFFYLGGCATLIRANLSSIPLYLFSLFSIQLSVAEMVEKIIGVDEGGRDHLLWKVC